MTIHDPSATIFSHSTDAAFRDWATELHNAMLAIGLVNTADTGQADLTTIVRAVGAVSGYKMYKTNDGLVDLYLKLEFGTTVSNSAYPQAFLTVGTGTNGAGVINATNSTTRQVTGSNASPNSLVTPYKTRGCGVPNNWWVMFKQNSMSTGAFFGFALSRFVDATGVATSAGFVLYHHASGDFLGQQVNIVTGSVSASSRQFCLLTANITSGNTGTDVQFWKHFVAQPTMQVNPFAVTCDGNIMLDGQTRSFAPLGPARTFICNNVGPFMRSAGAGGTTTNIPMLVWQ